MSRDRAQEIFLRMITYRFAIRIEFGANFVPRPGWKNILALKIHFPLKSKFLSKSAKFRIICHISVLGSQSLSLVSGSIFPYFGIRIFFRPLSGSGPFGPPCVGCHTPFNWTSRIMKFSIYDDSKFLSQTSYLSCSL